MITPATDELYRLHIQPLPPAQRLQLLARLAQELAEQEPLAVEPARSLLELEGLGAEIWEGIDAQGYVTALRSEWDHRP